MNAQMIKSANYLRLQVEHLSGTCWRFIRKNKMKILSDP